MQRTEIEMSFLAAKGLNTDFVQFLLANHVISSKVYACYAWISHMHECVRKTVLRALYLICEKL